MTEIINLNDAAVFDSFIQGATPVLVDFWAQWCAPCLTMTSILEEIAAECKIELLIVKIDIDENSEIPGKYRIRSIPTLLLLNNGEVVATAVGPQSKSKIEIFLEENLN